MQQKKIEVEGANIHQHISTGFSLAGYLLEAQDEGAALLAAMRAGYEILGAEGVAFVPFNEWKLTMPILTFGEAVFLQNLEWQARLSAPATRHACRNCETMQAGAECHLLREPAESQNTFCVIMRCSGREIGVVSYFFIKSPQVNDSQRFFLAEMVRLTDLAIDSLRAHGKQIEAARRAFTPLDLKGILLSQDAKNEELLGQLEYKAVLDERKRLAREIHDGLAQTLAFLKIEAARMQTYVSKGEVDAVTHTLQACHQTLSEAYLDARQAIDNLRHVPDEALSDWLRSTAADFQLLTDMQVDVSNIHLDHVFSPNIMAQLIRIVQEALTNVRKHAQSCTVTISAIECDGEAILEIGDNGRGFSPEEAQTTLQYGLRSMRERAESIHADFQVISAPGAGTTVRVQIPVREKSSP